MVMKEIYVSEEHGSGEELKFLTNGKNTIHMNISTLKNLIILMKHIENSLKNIGQTLIKGKLKESQFMKPNGSNDYPYKKIIV